MNATKGKRMIVRLLVAIALSNAALLWYGRDFITRGYGGFARLQQDVHERRASINDRATRGLREYGPVQCRS
jgi:hypothetical protein